MSYSSTMATAWSSGTNGNTHHRHTTHSVNLYVSTTSTTSSLKRRDPSGTGLHHQGDSSSPAAGNSLPSSSLAVLSPSDVNSSPSLSSSTTIKQPHHQQQQYLKIKHKTSLALLAKKATTIPTTTTHRHQCSYQVLPSYSPELGEPNLTLSSSASSAAVSSSWSVSSPQPSTPTTSASISNNGTVLGKGAEQQLRKAPGTSGASWFGSLRGLIIAGTSTSRGAFSPLTMDDKDRRSDDENEDDEEEEEEVEQVEKNTNVRRAPFGLERPGLRHDPETIRFSTSNSEGPAPSSTLSAKEKGGGSWDREMDEDKYGGAPSCMPPISSSSTSPNSSGLGSWLPSGISSIPTIALPSAPPESIKIYRGPQLTWSMLDPSQFGRTILSPLYQSVPGSAAAANLEEYMDAAAEKGRDESGGQIRRDGYSTLQ